MPILSVALRCAVRSIALEPLLMRNPEAGPPHNVAVGVVTKKLSNLKLMGLFVGYGPSLVAIDSPQFFFPSELKLFFRVCSELDRCLTKDP